MLLIDKAIDEIACCMTSKELDILFSESLSSCTLKCLSNSYSRFFLRISAFLLCRIAESSIMPWNSGVHKRHLKPSKSAIDFTCLSLPSGICNPKTSWSPFVFPPLYSFRLSVGLHLTLKTRARFSASERSGSDLPCYILHLRYSLILPISALNIKEKVAITATAFKFSFSAVEIDSCIWGLFFFINLCT